MEAYGTGDLEMVMRIPVPYRKWLIQRWNKQREKENPAQNNVNQPLPHSQRIKMIKEAQSATNKNSAKPSSAPLNQVRNSSK